MQSRDADDAVSVVSDRALVRVAIALSAALAGVLWMWGLPLANDGLTHVFQAYVHNHYGDPTLGFARFYDLLAPPTSNGFSDVQRVLEPVFGWQAAWRLNVVLACELWAWGFLAFVRAAAPARAAVGWLGFALALQASLWLGLLPFVYAGALCWFALAAWLRFGPSWPAALVLLVLMGGAARAHIVPPAMFGLVLGGITLAREPRAAWPRSVLMLVVAAIPALVVVHLSSGTTLDAADEPAWPAPLDRLLVVGTWFQSGPRWRHVLATALTLVAAWSIFARARARALSRTEAALGVCAIGILSITPALPEHVGGWQLGGMRALPLGVGLALSFLPIDRARLRLPLGALVAVYVLTSLLWASFLHRGLRAHFAPVLAGLSLPPHATDRAAILMPDPLPASLTPVRNFDPLLHLSNLYTLTRGGMDPYGHHGVLTMHHLRIKPAVARAGPSLSKAVAVSRLAGTDRSVALHSLLDEARSFGELVLIGTAADIDSAIMSGFEAALREPPLLVARFRGCEGRFEIVEATTPLEIELGWWPARSADLVEHWTPGPGAPTSLPLDRYWCGDVWVRVSGARSERCAGVAPGMPVRSTFSPGADNVLRCTVVSDAVPEVVPEVVPAAP